MPTNALIVADALPDQKPPSKMRGALSAIFKKENLAYLGVGAATSVAARAGGVALAGSAGAGAFVSAALPLTFGAAAAGGVSYYRDYRKRCAEALDAGQPKPAFVYSREKAREEGAFWKGFDTDGLKTAGKKSLFGLAGGAAIVSAIEFVPESWVEKLTETVKSLFSGLFESPKPAVDTAEIERIFKPVPLSMDEFEIRWAPSERDSAILGQPMSVHSDAPLADTLTDDLTDTGTERKVIIEEGETFVAPQEAAVIPETITAEEALANFTALPAGDRVAHLLFNVDLSGADLPRSTMLEAIDGHEWAIKDLAHFYANGTGGLPQDTELAAKLAMISAEQGHGPSVTFLTDLERVGLDVDGIRAGFAETLAEAANNEAAQIAATEATVERTVAEGSDVDISVSVVDTVSLNDQIQALEGLSPRADAIRQAALAGDSQSLGDMGLGLINERYGFPKDEALGVQLVLDAAENGNTNHRIWAAYLEYHGAEGLESNPNAALEKMREIDHPDARAFAAAWVGETLPAATSGETTDTLRIASIRVTGDATCYVKGTTEAFNLECHNVDEVFGSSNAQIGMVAPDGRPLDPILLNNISPNATPRDIILSHVREQIMSGNWKPEDMGLTQS